MTTQVAVIGLNISEMYYRQFRRLKRLWDEGNADKNCLVRNFAMWADDLTEWLLDQTKNHGSAFEIIEHEGRHVKLGLSDDLDAVYWTDKIIQQLSEQAGLSQLWDKWNNDL